MDDYSIDLFEEKISILNEYISKGEEILSNIQSWEVVTQLLVERDVLIEQLQALENTIKLQGALDNHLNTSQILKIKDLTKLALAIDKESIKQIQEEQKRTIQDMKNNQKHRKIANYEISMYKTYGNFLDVKK